MASKEDTAPLSTVLAPILQKFQPPSTLLSARFLDQGVYAVRTTDDDHYVIRVFPTSWSEQAVQQIVKALRHLEVHHFPAERYRLSGVDPSPFLVTSYIEGERVRGTKDEVREMATLLGRIHTLPSVKEGITESGGAWHQMVSSGGIREEVEAVANVLNRLSATNMDECETIAINQLRQIINSFLVLETLPKRLVHPDFVPSNAILSPDGKIHMVDWAGVGIGLRLYSLGFFLLVVSYRSVRLVDVAINAYTKFVQLEDGEIDNLELAMVARPLVIGCWEMENRGKRPTQVLNDHSARLQQAKEATARVKAWRG